MNETQLVKRQRNTLFACTVFSIAIHILAIFLLQKHSLWFYSPKDPLFATQDLVVGTSRPSSSEILKEVFQQMEISSLEKTILPGLEAISEQLSFHTTMPEFKKEISLIPIIIKEQLELHAQLIQDHEKNALDTQKWLDEHILQMQEIALEAFLIEDPVEEKIVEYLLQQESIDQRSLSFQTEPSPTLISETQRKLPFTHPWSPSDTKGSFMKNESIPVHPENVFSFQVPLPNLPSLNQLDTISCGEDFDIDLIFAPCDDDIGYIFALTLIPKPDLDLEKIKQNFIFLIDRFAKC